MSDREQSAVDGRFWSYRHAEKAKRKLMVAHCIEDFFGVGVQAWPLREGGGQHCGAIPGGLKNLRFMSHKIAPADSCVDGAIKHFCKWVEIVRCAHRGGLISEGQSRQALMV